MNLDDIKHDRLSEPEIFLLGIFDGMVEYNSDNVKYTNQSYYKKGNLLFFIYDSISNHLWYSHNNIWVVFHDRFGLNNQDINIIVQSMVGEYLKLKVDKTSYVVNL